MLDEKKVVFTEYTGIFYSDEGQLREFFWRVSGKKLDPLDNLTLVKARIDRLVEMVLSILDMRPKDFKVSIEIKPEYKSGDIAKYKHSRKTITVYADRVTDGVLAHEIAHAVICAYFPSRPPRKTQEILAQYVDRHLWEDY